LLTEDGRDTPALQAIRKVLAHGGLIGGTSAGAAIQSRIMIGGGSSMGALLFYFRAGFFLYLLLFLILMFNG
ncbi:MAG: hypothetical protein ACK4ON_03810, partial [Bacteroidia bacterium]